MTAPGTLVLDPSDEGGGPWPWGCLQRVVAVSGETKFVVATQAFVDGGYARPLVFADRTTLRLSPRCVMTFYNEGHARAFARAISEAVDRVGEPATVGEWERCGFMTAVSNETSRLQ